jgi:hypothetical protein
MVLDGILWSHVGLADILMGKAVVYFRNVFTFIFVLKKENLFQRRSSINVR